MTDETSSEPDPLVDSGLVQHLTDCLEFAKAGHLRSYVCVGVGRDGCSFSAFSTAEGDDTMLLIAEATLLTHRLTDRVRAVNDGRL